MNWLAGPLASKLPTILVGDLNSDDNTVEPGDQQAYRTLLAAGLRERSTGKPLGCCLNSSLLAEARRRQHRRLRPPGRSRHDPGPEDR